MNDESDRDNLLRLSYHPISTAGLQPSQNAELSERAAERGIVIDFEPFAPRRGGLPTANILGEPSKMIVEVAGFLTERTLLEVFVADLYLFFRHTIESAGGFKSAGISHYGIILRIRAGERLYNVGIDFKDENTLKINFFRLGEFMKNPSGKATELGVVELEYPKGDFEFLKKLPRGVIPTTVAAIIVAMLWGSLSASYGWIPITLLALVLISYLQIVIRFAWRRVVANKTSAPRPLDYYGLYAEDAAKWATAVSQSSDAKTIELEVISPTAGPLRVGDGDQSRPITVFYAYSHKDEVLRTRLETHLSLLKRQAIISDWHDRRIVPGAQWREAIDSHLNSAQLILLLVSPDFLASDYCYGVEVKRALARHASGEARVIPVILRPCDWQDAPFGRLQALPKDGRPVVRWPQRDQAFLDIVAGIRTVVQDMTSSGL